MFRKRKNREQRMDETWLIPYSDLLTLLLALFIILFAMGEVDTRKFEQMAQSFNIAFSGSSGALEFESSIPPQTIGSNFQRIDEKTLEYQLETEQLEKLKTKLDRYIHENNLASLLGTQVTDRGLLIIIQDQALFNSGSAEVLPESLDLANKIAVLLEEAHPRQVSISGHTDNVPINTREFPSNWELSSKRAVNFMKVILQNENLDPTTFSAVANGEYRPADTNDTPEGRAKNRRVEIAIERLFKE